MKNLNIIINQIKIDSKSKASPITRRNFNFETEIAEICKIAKEVVGEKFRFDSNNSEIIEILLNYFNGNPDFEKNSKYSLKKGIMLAGGVGTGKTDLLAIFKKYCFHRRTKHQFRIETVDNIVDSFIQNGVSGLNLYTDNLSETAYGIMTRKPISLCIDDLGIESENVKHYGTTEDVIGKVLFKRYCFQKEGILTHCTTNLSPSMLKEKYGERLFSRMREMFNYIVLKGEDRRM